jgi:hypothetical protein
MRRRRETRQLLELRKHLRRLGRRAVGQTHGSGYFLVRPTSPNAALHPPVTLGL